MFPVSLKVTTKNKNSTRTQKKCKRAKEAVNGVWNGKKWYYSYRHESVDDI